MRGPAIFLLLSALAACHADASSDRGATSPTVAPSLSVAPSPSAPPSPDASASPVVRVEDDGRTLDVTQGTTVTFELERHAATGFEWAPAPSDAGVLVQRGERRSVRTSDVAGAPKLDVYELFATTPGTETVEMQLRRPWEERPPVKTVRVTIRVR